MTILTHSLSVFYGLSVLASLFMPSHAHAKDTSELFAPIIKQTIEHVYQPAHRQFAQGTELFLSAALHGCQHRSVDALSELRTQFSLLVSAFSRIELYRIGPLLEDNRQNRLFFWPDKRRAGERQLRALLTDSTSLDLTGESLAAKSVALQGLPAIERLLFGKNATAHIATVSEAADCQVLIAIAQNMHAMANAMHAGWSSQSSFVQSMFKPEEGSDYFRTTDEILRSMVTQIIVGVDVVLNKKIAPLNVEDARWKEAPLWLSKQTIPMIKVNLDSLRALIVDSGLAEMTNLENELSFEFRTAESMLQALLELPAILDGSGQLTEEAQSLIRSLAAVAGGIAFTLNDRFTQTLGISAGFNSEDGD